MKRKLHKCKYCQHICTNIRLFFLPSVYFFLLFSSLFLCCIAWFFFVVVVVYNSIYSCPLVFSYFIITISSYLYALIKRNIGTLYNLHTVAKNVPKVDENVNYDGWDYNMYLPERNASILSKRRIVRCMKWMPVELSIGNGMARKRYIQEVPLIYYVYYLFINETLSIFGRQGIL